MDWQREKKRRKAAERHLEEIRYRLQRIIDDGIDTSTDGGRKYIHDLIDSHPESVEEK